MSKIQFFVGYPDDTNQILMIKYKKDQNTEAKPIVSVLINKITNMQNINIVFTGFPKFKELFNFLKENSSKITTINEGQVVMDDASKNAELQKKITELTNTLNPGTFVIGSPQTSNNSFLGGAKKRKRSKATTKRRKKQSSKTRRL